MAEEEQQKIATIGKGYSYLFASFLTGLVALQSVNLSLETGANKLEIKISTKEVPAHVFIPSVALIASILGLNTDSIAMAIGKFFSRESN
ncbi:hypothetical protein CAL7716_085640 [Calothrix sp. PCC 7716]|nr:hypothetical protein CAL7716_085640 [Calothrix sp. PCC 7716]